MFTGIIETMGRIESVAEEGSNRTFWVRSPLSSSFKPDQSVSHSGVCLTVEEVRDDLHRVTAIRETLDKTNLGDWQPGCLVNIERCLQLNGRLDGHFVQGHVDTTGTCIIRTAKDGSFEFDIRFSETFAPLVIEKGSICLNGISLTAFAVTRNSFRVAIIPFTYEHTNLQELKEGDVVNLEFDMIGKYLLRSLSLREKV
ncbi:MAG: riboflavin synthase subunit alpha [Sphingobacteriales bacterium SCN 48-20]|nr:riboflavin synthase [Terrimonas ferruginea]ODT93132.1 MAG: riboflavin synthase subunit alpha [Sphingobacteriales bacterium SCN 48-20]OJW40921.1 MAG: riboflavin synthase subunit alpha [Sphingobacteriales bacterium 48-107]